MNDDTTPIDLILSEYWSFLVYKKGKKPLHGEDPKMRIKKGIWKDEGVDLTLFLRSQDEIRDVSDASAIFSINSIEVREGFLRKRVEHDIIVGLKEISELVEIFSGKNWNGEKKLTDLVLGSDILFPIPYYHVSSGLDGYVKGISIQRRRQTDHDEISPEMVLKRKLFSTEHHIAGEDIKGLYRKKIDKDKRFKTQKGRKMKDLSFVIDHIFSCSDGELSTIISNGTLVKFASEGLFSNVLEALFKDLTRRSDGEYETPEGFRSRFGRWVMESPLGDEIIRDLIPRLISRLSSCSEGEAGKLEDSLENLMDPRSTSLLTEKVFSVDPEKRPYFIRLLGSTRDRAAQDPLRRLMDFSNLEDDRKSAEEALRSMGIEI